MQGVPHYLIDFLDPKEDFNVVMFQRMVKDAIKDISSRGKIPILVGGTGFYIQAVLYDVDFTETDDDDSFRKELEKRAEMGQAHELFLELEAVDPESAKIIHENNVKRVIRALEFYKKTGRPISEHNKKQHENVSPYDFSYFVLTDDREELYSRIDKRVDLMIEEGLEAEVKDLLKLDIPLTATSMQSLGYREMIGYLNGEYDLERAIYLIKRNTRHFAKRQLTWFRRENDVRWIDKRDFDHDDDRILEEMIKVFKNE
jgi:tRNA dimethylallyltransferase